MVVVVGGAVVVVGAAVVVVGGSVVAVVAGSSEPLQDAATSARAARISALPGCFVVPCFTADRHYTNLPGARRAQ